MSIPSLDPSVWDHTIEAVGMLMLLLGSSGCLIWFGFAFFFQIPSFFTETMKIKNSVMMGNEDWGKVGISATSSQQRFPEKGEAIVILTESRREKISCA